MIIVKSGGYKFGRLDCNFIFDATYLRNPWREGQELYDEAALDEFFDQDEKFNEYLEAICAFITQTKITFPNGDIVVGIMCSSGKFRSPYLATKVVEELNSYGMEAKVIHRDLR